MPVAAFAPAPLTVICPEPKSRPPWTSRLVFSDSAPSSTRAITPIAIPPAVSAVRAAWRRSSRIAWATMEVPACR